MLVRRHGECCQPAGIFLLCSFFLTPLLVRRHRDRPRDFKHVFEDFVHIRRHLCSVRVLANIYAPPNIAFPRPAWSYPLRRLPQLKSALPEDGVLVASGKETKRICQLRSQNLSSSFIRCRFGHNRLGIMLCLHGKIRGIRGLIGPEALTIPRRSYHQGLNNF